MGGGGEEWTLILSTPPFAGLPPDLLRYIGGRSGEVGPATHPTVARVFEERRQRLEAGSRLDWATGESLAVGSLLMQGQGHGADGRGGRGSGWGRDGWGGSGSGWGSSGHGGSEQGVPFAYVMLV